MSVEIWPFLLYTKTNYKGDIQVTTLKELRATAKAQGIKGYSRMNKAQLETATASAPQPTKTFAKEVFECEKDGCYGIKTYNWETFCPKCTKEYEADRLDQNVARHEDFMAMFKPVKKETTTMTTYNCETKGCTGTTPASFITWCSDCESKRKEMNKQPVTGHVCSLCKEPVEDESFALCEDCENGFDYAPPGQQRANEVSAQQQVQQAPVQRQQQQRQSYNNMDTTTRPMQSYNEGKLIQFVRANDNEVCFYAKGKKVRVYIDDNMKMVLHSERRGRTTVTYAQLIDMMNRFNNNTHGDVARVVKAIVRLNKNLIQAKLDLHQARRNCR